MNCARPDIRIPLLFSAFILLVGMFLYTHGNTFPYNYHPDEPVKVKQLISGELNFHHPLLLLSAADCMRVWRQAGDDSQKVVEAGRIVSALFASIGVLSFMWIGWLKGGPWVAATVTAFLLPHHQVFELAHYLKEDTALFMGIGLTFLALAWAGRVKTTSSIGWLGAACGVAFSAKYLGLASLVVALIWLIFSREEMISARRGKMILIFLAAFLLVAIAVNFQFLLHFGSVQTSFEREVDMVVNGQGGVTRQVPNWQYTGIFLDNTNPVIWLGLLGCLIYGWRERHKWTLEDWLPVAFSWAFVIMLSFSPKSNDRYFLPLTGMVCLASGWGLTRVLSVAKCSQWKWLGIMLALGSALPGLMRYDKAFKVDDRNDLREWISQQLPASAFIAQEKTVCLPGSGKKDSGIPLPQKFTTLSLAPDLGNLDDLRQKGVTHLLVSQSVYGKFFLESLHPGENERELFETRKAFYIRLFLEGKLIWKRPRSTVIYLHPGMELYDIGSPQ